MVSKMLLVSLLRLRLRLLPGARFDFTSFVRSLLPFDDPKNAHELREISLDLRLGLDVAAFSLARSTGLLLFVTSFSRTLLSSFEDFRGCLPRLLVALVGSGGSMGLLFVIAFSSRSLLSSFEDFRGGLPRLLAVTFVSILFL